MSALQELVAAAAELVPGWEGAVAPPGADAAWHEAAVDELAALRGAINGRHPEAGPAYAAVRGWGLLVWQPLYLGVIASHLMRISWLTRGLSQPIDNGSVGGFRFTDHRPARHADPVTAMQAQALPLRAGCERLRAAWREASSLHPRSARRIEADCVLAALLAVSRCLAWRPAELRRHAQGWLEALGLSGESGYVFWRDAAGMERVALDRRICCLDFRRSGGSLCSTCPRLPAVQRLHGLAA